jgi:2-(1,2-epoxy-1,2-dihydrophenyl)acetyl-CoA isomerase
MERAMPDNLLYSIKDRVATITFNRPQVLNAINSDTMIALRDLTLTIKDDADVRAVLLRGAGNAFMAGGDVSEFHTKIADMPKLIVHFTREYHAAILNLRQMGKPVVACVHGVAAGAGMGLVCAADLAIAADNTVFTLAYSNIGAIPDGGTTYCLPRLVGYHRAMQLALLPDRFDAKTALELGIVNWIAPPEQLEARTHEIMTRLANGPAVAFAQTKHLMNQSINNTLAEQLEAESQAFAIAARSPDFVEGVAAFTEKRKPRFSGK